MGVHYTIFDTSLYDIQCKVFQYKNSKTKSKMFEEVKACYKFMAQHKLILIFRVYYNILF